MQNELLNKWEYFLDKYPLQDCEILVFSNKKNKFYIEFTDSEFSKRCTNRNYIKWILLRFIKPY